MADKVTLVLEGAPTKECFIEAKAAIAKYLDMGYRKQSSYTKPKSKSKITAPKVITEGASDGS